MQTSLTVKSVVDSADIGPQPWTHDVVTEHAPLTTTGGQLWDAARRLCSYLEQQAGPLGLSRPGLSVLELGAGLGWLGMMLARNTPTAGMVVLTEQEEGGGLDWLRHNVALNAALPGMAALRAEACDWRAYGDGGGGGGGGGVACAAEAPGCRAPAAAAAAAVEEGAQAELHSQGGPEGPGESACSAAGGAEAGPCSGAGAACWAAELQGGPGGRAGAGCGPPRGSSGDGGTGGRSGGSAAAAGDGGVDFSRCCAGSGHPSSLETGGADGCDSPSTHRPGPGGGSGSSHDSGPDSRPGSRPGWLSRQRWDLILGSDLVYNEIGAVYLPRVMRALAGPDTTILYCHTRHRFDTFDMQFFEQLDACGLAWREVREPGLPSPPPSPPPLTELFPEMRIAVYDIRLRPGAPPPPPPPPLAL